MGGCDAGGGCHPRRDGRTDTNMPAVHPACTRPGGLARGCGRVAPSRLPMGPMPTYRSGSTTRQSRGGGKGVGVAGGGYSIAACAPARTGGWCRSRRIIAAGRRAHNSPRRPCVRHRRCRRRLTTTRCNFRMKAGAFAHKGWPPIAGRVGRPPGGTGARRSHVRAVFWRVAAWLAAEHPSRCPAPSATTTTPCRGRGGFWSEMSIRV